MRLVVAVLAAVALALALPGGVAAGDGDDRDPSFSRDGLRHVDFGRREDGTHLFAEGGGSIYVAGGSHVDFFAQQDQRPVLARLLPDGRLDRSFGDGGGVFIDPTGNSDSALAWARGRDGAFIVLSRTLVRSERTGFSLARLLANGELDRSFGSGGVVQGDRGNRFGPSADVAMLRDGSVLAMGDLGSVTRVTRYRPNGSVDRSLAGSGTLRIRSFSGMALLALPNGRFVVVGTKRERPSHRIVLAAFNRHGEPRRGFGDQGRARLSITGPGNVTVGISDATLADDGAIVLAGGHGESGTFAGDTLVARFTAGGQVDTSFSKNGWRSIDIGPRDGASGVSTAPDGRIFVAGLEPGDIFGDTPSQTIVAALEPDGHLLRSFADGGKLTTAFGTDDEYFGNAALYDRGKLLVAGAYREFPIQDETGDMFVARFLIE